MKTATKYRARPLISVFAVITGLAVSLATLNLAAASASAKPSAPVPARPEQGRVIANADGFAVLSRRARIEPENRILVERLEKLLPRLMAETNLDMWLIINRE